MAETMTAFTNITVYTTAYTFLWNITAVKEALSYTVHAIYLMNVKPAYTVITKSSMIMRQRSNSLRGNTMFLYFMYVFMSVSILVLFLLCDTAAYNKTLTFCWYMLESVVY